MKLLISILGLSFSFLCLAQTSTTTAPYAPLAPTPKKEEVKLKGEDDCVPAKPTCPPKPKPKPKPKPPACEPKIITKTVTKTITKTVEKPVEKIVEKKVEVEKKVYVESPKNTISVLAGMGPSGIVVDSYETEQRDGEYAVRKEKSKPSGAIFGLQYQYHFTPSWNVGATVLSNQSYLGSAGYSW